MATVTLGRDGMGANATNADFESWVAFVSARIDAACGFEVSVKCHGRRDVQTDAFTGDDVQCETMREAVASLWNQWCAEGAPES